jgi:hypothetical protein
MSTNGTEWRTAAAARESLLPTLNPTALASYTYYQSLRAVPALIRQAWEGYRSKQLAAAVAQSTARYFSPLLIASELSGLESGGMNDASEDEQMIIKVLRSINEVRATVREVTKYSNRYLAKLSDSTTWTSSLLSYPSVFRPTFLCH